MGSIFNVRNQQLQRSVSVDSITLGTVISTNDPHQMGRLKVACVALGDDPNDLTGEDLPWAMYLSPLGGMTNSTFMRGPNAGNLTKGPVAYGLWGIPKRGSTVLICCVDGDPYHRVWIGSVFDQGSVNTLPHGRYFYQSNQNGSGTPEGPLDSNETPIQPLYDNQIKAFTRKTHNYEWRTRGADYSVGGNSAEFVDHSPSPNADETDSIPFTSEDGNTFNIQNGYAQNRMAGEGDTSEDSVYSWTTPGFHSISMDDRPEACKIKIRSTSGSQIIMDDTNERIYINTAEGKNWVEMDFNGNIDIYGRNISMFAEEQINLTANDTIRMFGTNGIHMYSKEGPIALESEQQIGIHSHANVEILSDQSTNITSKQDINVAVSNNFTLSSSDSTISSDSNITLVGSNVNVSGSSDLIVTSGGSTTVSGSNVNVSSSGDLTLSTPGVVNGFVAMAGTAGSLGDVSPIGGSGGSPASKVDATESSPDPAKWTMRLPSHEPMARVMTANDYTHDPEFDYDDPSVGKVERGTTIPRGPLWRR